MEMKYALGWRKLQHLQRKEAIITYIQIALLIITSIGLLWGVYQLTLPT